MDRLSKALEKARSDRAAGIQPGVPSVPARVPLGAGKAPVQIPEARVLPVDAHYAEAHRVLAGAAQDHALSAFKLLRTQILQRMRSNGWQTLVVTSPSQGNGKTVTAINLAINLARHAHQQILLVDLDLRRPSIHKYLCSESVPGISDYILGDAGVEEILFSPGIEGLTVLPGRETFSHSAEALLRHETLQLISDLRTRFTGGLIIFDMPPVLAVDDVVAFSGHWDAALLVVEEGRTTGPDVRRSLDLLKSKAMVGTVLTKSHDTLPDYGY